MQIPAGRALRLVQRQQGHHAVALRAVAHTTHNEHHLHALDHDHALGRDEGGGESYLKGAVPGAGPHAQPPAAHATATATLAMTAATPVPLGEQPQYSAAAERTHISVNGGVAIDLTGDGQRESVGYDTTGDGLGW